MEKQNNAEAKYSAAKIDEAKQVFKAMSLVEQTELTNNSIAGLPGKMTDSYGLNDFRSMLANGKGMISYLRKNLIGFPTRGARGG